MKKEEKKYISMEDLPVRVQENIFECSDPDPRKFDWDRYQELCDMADYWGCDE